MGVSEVMPALLVEVDFPISGSNVFTLGDATNGQLGTGALASNNAFEGITSYVRSGEIIRGTSRFDGVYARSEAGTCVLTLDNRDARFDPTNLSGPYVSAGVTQVKPNREVRVRVPTGINTTSVLVLDGSLNTHATTPDDATLDITGDIDVRIRVNPVQWSTGASGTFGPYAPTLVSKAAAYAFDSAYSWEFWVTVDQPDETTFHLSWMDSGGTYRQTDSDPFTPSPSYFGTRWLRVTLDVDNGAGNHTVRFYTSTDDTSDHTAVSWTEFGSGYNAGTGATTSIQSSTGKVTVGATGDTFRLIGTVYAAAILSGIGGTVVANPDFTAEDPSITVFDDAAGRTWSLTGNAAFQGGGEVVHELYRGFVQAWRPTYPGANKDAIVTASAIDGTSVFAGYDGAQQSSQGGSEDSGARITRIADNIGWPSAQRDIDTGIGTCQATTLAQNAWSEVLLTSDSELGEVYFDGAGKLVFRNRHALVTDARSAASQAIFGDGTGELPYADLVISSDSTQVRNLALVTRTGGTQQSAEDLVSQGENRVRTFTRSDFIFETDAVSQSYANFVVAIFADADVRFDSITLNPRKDPDLLFPQVLERELGDRITIRLRPLGRTDVVEKDCFIRGIRHRWDASSWETTWTLQDATKLGSVFTLGSEIAGRLGSARLGF